MVTHDEETLRKMISNAEPIMEEANLEVKGSKCAAFYDRKSGNNWYKGKMTKSQKLTIQSQVIDVLLPTKPYTEGRAPPLFFFSQSLIFFLQLL